MCEPVGRPEEGCAIDREAEHKRPVVHAVLQDATIGENMRAVLTRLGCDVRLYSSAEAFLPGPRNGAAGCLVTEPELPGVSGQELLELLKAEGRLPPTFVLTDRGDVRAVVRAMRAGAAACIEKPHFRHLLPREIRRFFDLRPS